MHHTQSADHLQLKLHLLIIHTGQRSPDYILELGSTFIGGQAAAAPVGFITELETPRL